MWLYAIAICSALFGVDQPPSKQMLAIYSAAYGCEAKAVDLNGAMRRLPPLSSARNYFQAPTRFWPMLAHDDPALTERLEGWLARGVSPGLMLPDDGKDLIVDDAVRNKIRAAVERGALPVLPVRRPVPRWRDAQATLYAGLGLPPYALMIRGGYGLDVAGLPPGRYLIEGHLGGNRFAIPIPARRLSLRGVELIPFYFSPPPGGGFYAAYNAEDDFGIAFTPDLGVKWSFLGVTMETDRGGLQADVLGHFVSAATTISAFIWTWAQRPLGDTISAFSTGFAWLVLVGGIVVLVVMTLALGREWLGRVDR